MGNQASSSGPLSPVGPCFDEEVYTTLSWAEKKVSCRNIFDGCEDRNNVYEEDDSKTKTKESSNRVDRTEQRTRATAFEQLHGQRDDQRDDIMDETSAHSLTSNDKTTEIPALTDNISSSEDGDPSRPIMLYSSEDHIDNDDSNTNGIASPNDPLPVDDKDVIDLVDYPEHEEPLGEAEMYLQVSPSADTAGNSLGTSGSLDRDARADLGTLRGGGSGSIGGGRED